MGKILIVDDSVLIRELLVATLGSDGHDVRIAVDGVEAIRLVRESHPELVILDWMMPRLDGIGCLRCLRRNRETRRIPVIMLSGNVTRDLVLEAAQHGIGGFYSKENLSLADLRQRVQELLAGSSTVSGNAADGCEAEAASIQPLAGSENLGPSQSTAPAAA